jgi:hypothetical protein
MKLPDFKAFAPLNALKDRMGIPRNVFGSLHVEVAPGRLTLTDLRALGSPKGLDVSIDDISVLPDGTLGLKGQRVVLYIRDVSNYGGKISDPRFHLANCSVLQRMRENRRFGRYVANNDTKGEFKINLIGKGKTKELNRRLNVCQNCLDFLRYGNFQITSPSAQRSAAVSAFSMTEFFTKYPKSFHAEFPKYNSKTAPLNDYARDFVAISRRVREQNDWVCENPACRVNLSSMELRRYLHVHHVNGEKYDNASGNLRALCLYCHAEEPAHSHLKHTLDYKQFVRLRSSLLIRQPVRR